MSTVSEADTWLEENCIVFAIDALAYFSSSAYKNLPNI